METCHLQPSRPSLPPHSSPLRTLTSDLIMTSCWPPLGLRSPLILVFGLVCASGGGETPCHLLFLPPFSLSRSLALSLYPSLSFSPSSLWMLQCVFICMCMCLAFVSVMLAERFKKRKKKKTVILCNVNGQYIIIIAWHGMLSLLTFLWPPDVNRNLLLCDLLNMQ